MIFLGDFLQFIWQYQEKYIPLCRYFKESPGGEMADALVSGTSGVTSVSVRLRSRAPKEGDAMPPSFFIYSHKPPNKIKSPLYQSSTLPDNETPSIRNRNWQITHKRNQNKKEKQLVLVWEITFLRIKRNFWLFLLQQLLLFIHYADYTVVCNLYYIMHSRQQIPEKHKDAPTPANYM